MSQYHVERVMKDGFEVVVLYDAATQSTVELVPQIGNNVYSFESRGRQVLESPPSLRYMIEDPFHAYYYGTPLLFPPNRIPGGTFTYKGREYRFPLNEEKFHLHGEISMRPWELVACGASDERGAYAISRFKYRDHPDLLAFFPHALTFTIECVLKEGGFSLSGSIVNEGVDEAPFAFGLHPYFVVPFGQHTDIRLQMPAVSQWEVSNLALVQAPPAPTTFSDALPEGASIADFPQLSCAMFSLREGGAVTRLQMKELGYSIVYATSREFPIMLVYRPEREASFSLEPYTYATDGFNLPYDSSLTGARGIAAGETISFRTTTWVEED